MPRTKSSANSASKDNVAKVSQPVGRPNQSIAAMKEEFARQDELAKQNFKKAEEALKKYIDPNKNSSGSQNSYTREMIRGYLQNPAKNESSLRAVARYLFYRSQILYRLVHWYAGMWDLRCRNVQPTFDIINGLDKNVLKNYNDTLKQLDIYNLQENLYEVFVNCYLYDVCYFLWFRDDTGAIPYILNPDECKIIGRYITGDLAFCIDMSKWKKPQRQQLIEWLGSPLKEMWNEYERTKVKWIQVPDEYSGCFKFNVEDLFNVIPPFSPIFQNLSGLLDTEDLAGIKDKLDVFKMLVYKIKTIDSSKQINDFKVDPELALQYLDRVIQDALPPYVTVAPLLGEGFDVVDFSSTTTDAESDRVATAQTNILNTSGGGAILNSGLINNTLMFKTWLSAESEFAISSLIGQVDGFTNRMLSYDVSKPCKVNHFELTVYTKDDFRASMLEANQYSYSYRLALGTLYGMSELDTLASLHFEQELLGLQNLMIHPLQSSYTSTGIEEGTDPVTGGRPTIDDDELSPTGEKSRNE